MRMDENFDPEVISETENFAVWRSEEDEGYIYHLELGGITLHIQSEEWEEVLTLFKSIT
ncbi:MAG: hypothetical protein KC421_30285 [Anaerolineales bacterium]|nr:hypothetical protein [Anaerolineales bacterium]